MTNLSNKKKNKTIKFKKSSCNPSKTKSLNFTCFSTSQIINLKNIWNLKHPTESIISNDPQEIWNFFRQKFSEICSTERCWLKQEFFKRNLGPEILSYSFAPKAPSSWNKNINEWLSSTDITKVMKLYEEKYPYFAFIGPSPIDFDKKLIGGDCVWEELCNFNLQNMLIKGKKKIGIVFNTDPHNKDGEHWVAAFIDTSSNPDPYFFYFDSNGDTIPKEIKNISNKGISQAKNIEIDMKCIENHPTEHQKGDTECGIYVIYFITELLSGNKIYNYFLNNKIPDNQMEQFREVFFDLS